jgi:hypothetical protein
VILFVYQQAIPIVVIGPGFVVGRGFVIG